MTRKLRDSERKVCELERNGSNQAEFDVKIAEVQNEVEKEVRTNRRLTENLDKTTEKLAVAEEELKKMKGTMKETENRKGQEGRRRDQLELELQAKTEVLNQANDKISELEDLIHEKARLRNIPFYTNFIFFNTRPKSITNRKSKSKNRFKRGG